ncbi:MAG: polymer-forming cytoskeletal protein [Ignavibacteria bacterium]|nr:polymer-forming cytoskeletal protein [Ignavibacteria bacterium]
MFGQKNKESLKDTLKDTFVNPVSKSEQNKIKTVISEGCKFEGNLYFPDYTRIDGRVVGNLSGENGVVIGDKGLINGDVSSVEVIIYGEVKGNVKAHKLEIKKGGRLNGDVDIELLLMDQGAIFNGNCRMNSEPPIDTSKPEEERI